MYGVHIWFEKQVLLNLSKYSHENWKQLCFDNSINVNKVMHYACATNRLSEQILSACYLLWLHRTSKKNVVLDRLVFRPGSY